MRWFANLKTMTKLAAGFGAVCMLLAGLGGFSLVQLQSVNQLTSVMANEALPQVKHLGLMSAMNAAFRIKELQHILSTTDEDMAKWESEMAAIREKYRVSDEAIGSLLATDAERKLFDEYNALRADYYSQTTEILKFSRKNQNVEARDLLRGKSFELFYASTKKLQELTDITDATCKSLSASAESTYDLAQMWVIGLLLGGVAAGGTIAVFVGRMIARPLGGAVAVLERVAAGDFTQRLDVDSKDEVGQMAQALNKAVSGVRDALNEVRIVSEGLASASSQLSAASQEISSGAQEQASNLEETASSLEEITSTVKQNADNAQQANQLASRSREVAEKGGQVVHNAVAGMGEINKASKQIADIITAIDEIAFQTNLLALNAAVEAARAGEQGRGFAVVAAEVRNLAQRSAGAAKEIKGLIQDSVRKVEVGSELVNESGETLQEIVTSVKRVTDIVGEIAAASREQSTGIDQVSKAVAQMDQVTQTNASQTEELSGTAESLAGQAHQLQELVARFKLDAEGTATKRPAVGFKPTSRTPVKGRPKSPSVASRSSAAEPENLDKRIESDLDLIAAGIGNEGFAEF